MRIHPSQPCPRCALRGERRVLRMVEGRSSHEAWLSASGKRLVRYQCRCGAGHMLTLAEAIRESMRAA